MVHALHEAWRVLQPNGILFDLRPMPVHRHIGIQNISGREEIGLIHESFENDYLANQAVKQVLHDGVFKSEKYVEFNCNRVMDSFKEFETWLFDFIDRNHTPSPDRLLKRIKHAYAATSGKKKIIASAPLMLRRLRKLSR